MRGVDAQASRTNRGDSCSCQDATKLLRIYTTTSKLNLELDRDEAQPHLLRHFIQMSPWRNWLARPTVNREVDSSILSGDACFFALSILSFLHVRSRFYFCGSGWGQFVGEILALYGTRVWVFGSAMCGMILVDFYKVCSMLGMCAHMFTSSSFTTRLFSFNSIPTSKPSLR
jgi:hypothetical protein